MKVGSKSINIRNFTVNDDERSRAPQSMKMGWFYLRVTQQITPSELGNLGFSFSSSDVVQNGWFKKFLNEEQVERVRKLNKFSLIPAKNYQKPNFASLREAPRLRVVATENWVPAPPATAMKEGGNVFIVSGQSAEKIFEDPRVCFVEEAQFATPI